MARIQNIETLNKEYCVVYSDDNNVIVHIGMYEAILNNSQVDDLIKALKKAKINK